MLLTLGRVRDACRRDVMLRAFPLGRLIWFILYARDTYQKPTLYYYFAVTKRPKYTKALRHTHTHTKPKPKHTCVQKGARFAHVCLCAQTEVDDGRLGGHSVPYCALCMRIGWVKFPFAHIHIYNIIMIVSPVHRGISITSIESGVVAPLTSQWDVPQCEKKTSHHV